MKNSKKLIALLLSLVMVFSLVACNTSKDTKNESSKESTEESKTEESKTEESKEETTGEAKDFSGKLVGMVTDTGGVDDQSFNQSSWEGLQKFEKDTKAKTTYVQSEHKADFLPNLNQLLDKEADLSWGVGFLLAESIKEVSKQAPDKQFAIIDMAYPDAATLPNVTGVVFRAQEPSYLVGYLAAHETKTNKVGFVGGVEGVVISQFDYGFRAGVEDAAKELGKKVEVIVQYANSFDDQAIGKSIATKMFADGADIVFHAAGGVGIGVIEAAKEAKKFAIGVDQDQSYLAPQNVLTSALKRVDKAIYDLSSRILSGEKLGGTTVEYTSIGGFVGIPEWNDKALYSKEVYDKVMVKQKEIVDGKLVPPFNAESFEKYQSKQQ